LRGVFGNNAIWFIPISETGAGNAELFGYGSRECETTVPFFLPDEETFNYDSLKTANAILDLEL
jgi:secreted PhoX family phosphatase